MPETAEQLTRIAAHIPCLERAAQDPTATPEVRARIALMAFLARSAVDVAGSDRTGTDRSGWFRMVPDDTGCSRTGADGSGPAPIVSDAPTEVTRD